ncbi:MAG: YfjI family protein, partial [Rubrobacteraceae bacterium]
KWGREDYRERTIARALAREEFYLPEADGVATSRNGRSGNSENTDREYLGFPPALPEAPSFPVEAMPAACRPLIEESEKALGCAPEMVALPMLAVLSSAIGTSRVVEVKGGWREWAALFVAVVASPGAMKTPAAKVAKRPAFERQRKLGKHYAEEKDEWKREVRQWEVDKREAAKSAEPAPEEPEAPSMSRCVASDTTVEALVGILEDNPRGLLVHKDELAGWVRSMDQYKGGKGSDRQHWLSFWSGDEVVVDRKSRMGEPLIVAEPFVSLFGGIQPAMLGELGAGAEDGLMDRFLFAYPKPRHVRFSYEEVSTESEGRYAALYERLADLPLAIDEHGDPNPKPLKLSLEARRLFAERMDSIGAEMLEPGFPARLEGVWSKLRGHLARLSLVLAVCRCLEGGVREERVEREDVEAASALLAYFAAHARRVYEELAAPDPLDLLAAELRDLLEESDHGWEGSATDLHEALGERGAAGLPERPEELSKLALRIGERSPALEVSQGWRKVGGRKGSSRRVLRLALARKAPENAVGPVVTVDPEPGGDNGTNGNNSDPKPPAPGGDNGDYGNNGDPPRERDGAEAANLRGSSDGRSRFTI